jgi:hypothetical protein
LTLKSDVELHHMVQDLLYERPSLTVLSDGKNRQGRVMWRMASTNLFAAINVLTVRSLANAWGLIAIMNSSASSNP